MLFNISLVKTDNVKRNAKYYTIDLVTGYAIYFLACVPSSVSYNTIAISVINKLSSNGENLSDMSKLQEEKKNTHIQKKQQNIRLTSKQNHDQSCISVSVYYLQTCFKL